MLFKEYVEQNKSKYPKLEKVELLSAFQFMLASSKDDVPGQWQIDAENDIWLIDTRSMKTRSSAQKSVDESELVLNRLAIVDMAAGGPVATLIFDDELEPVELMYEITLDLWTQIEAWGEDEDKYTATYKGWNLIEHTQLCWTLYPPNIKIELDSDAAIVLSMVPRIKNYGIEPYVNQSVCVVAAMLIINLTAIEKLPKSFGDVRVYLDNNFFVWHDEENWFFSSEADDDLCLTIVMDSSPFAIHEEALQYMQSQGQR